MTSANKQYKYDAIYHEKPLSYWVTEIHKYMSSKSRWKYFPLTPGSFGFDNQVLSIAYTFDNYKSGMSIDDISSLVHDGWIINYTFWRDVEPWKKNKFYTKPSKPLGDKRRDMCASVKYEYLPEDEKEKDTIIAEYLSENVFNKRIDFSALKKITKLLLETKTKEKETKIKAKTDNNKTCIISYSHIQQIIFLLSEINILLKNRNFACANK